MMTSLRLITACPDCALGRDARAMFVELDVLYHLAIAVLPFAICLAVIRAFVRRADRLPIAHRHAGAPPAEEDLPDAAHDPSDLRAATRPGDP